jgi:hypothetical protein
VTRFLGIYTDPILYEKPIDKITDRWTEMQIGKELSNLGYLVNGSWSCK